MVGGHKPSGRRGGRRDGKPLGRSPRLHFSGESSRRTQILPEKFGNERNKKLEGLGFVFEKNVWSGKATLKAIQDSEVRRTSSHRIVLSFESVRGCFIKRHSLKINGEKIEVPDSILQKLNTALSEAEVRDGLTIIRLQGKFANILLKEVQS